MVEARILVELTEKKSELPRLKERMSIGAPTVHKDLSLISLVPKWSDLDSGVTLEEFFASKNRALAGRPTRNCSNWISWPCETVLSRVHRTTRRNHVASFQECIQASVQRHTYRPVTLYKTANSEARTKRESTGVRGSL
jgi:hypothetical protein